MMNWFIGVSGAIIVGTVGWMTTFILMGYQAQADISDLKFQGAALRGENSQIKSDLSAVKAITLRTEKNTEAIRDYLLKKSLPNGNK